MDPKLNMLTEILKRNSDDPDSVDMLNEVDHYFFFQSISNADDLEAAWALFDEHKEIRSRLLNLENSTREIPGWGYLIPQLEQVRCSEDELLALVSSHISMLRPLLLQEDYNEEIISFIDRGFAIETAPAPVEIPDVSENELFGVLYEAISEYRIEHYPYDIPHYEVLRNWAIYLTKCDEVACYLLWPCLKHKLTLPDTCMDAGAKLWKLGCRDRYWVKDLDFESKTVYFRAPWMDKRN